MTYENDAQAARLKVLDMIYVAQTSHIGSNFSCIDIMTVLFDKIDLEKDKFILSKGWAAASLYYFLWKKGRITEDELNSYCKDGSAFIGLAEPIHPDIPFAGGSMGMGFPAAVGFALSKKLKGDPGTVYCLMSDGEMQIGTTWESALIAAQYKLNNLVVFVDYNKLQAMGNVGDILGLDSLEDKWKAFNWNVFNIDGHDFNAINHVIETGQLASPTIVIAHTIKGKGVSFMENQNIYHYKAPSEEEFIKAKQELNG